MLEREQTNDTPLELVPGLTVASEVRVRYGETDQMGVVYHGKYIEYMEIGRTEFMRAVGYPYRRMEEMGHFFVVVEISAKLHAPARYDSLIRVLTSIIRLRPSSLVFHYELTLAEDAGNTLLTTGTTRLACLDAKTRQVRPIPQEFAEMVRRVLPETNA